VAARSQLEASGHEVAEAADGAERLRLYRERSPDVVLRDLFMPRKDGLEVIRELCQEGKARVVAMTGDGGPSAAGLLRVAERLGAVGSLRKPFSQDELLAAVDAALEPE